MSEPIAVDLFVEDTAHEVFLRPLVARLAEEEGVPIRIQVRSALGGHPRAMEEFRLYQRTAPLMAFGGGVADLVVVAIDANCSSFAKARQSIRDSVQKEFAHRVIAACPDPHIERWYLADPDCFRKVVGRGPDAVPHKCARGYYKQIVNSAVRKAGHQAGDGEEFGGALAVEMDAYRAAKADPSLKAFLDDFRAALRHHARAEPTQ